MKKLIIIILAFMLAIPACSLAIKEESILGTWVNIFESANSDDYFLNIYHFFPDHTVYCMTKEICPGSDEPASEHIYKWEIDYGNIIIWMDDFVHYVIEYSDKDNVLFGGQFDFRYRLIYSRYNKKW